MSFFSENVPENKDEDRETKANKEEYSGSNQFYGMHVFKLKANSRLKSKIILGISRNCFATRSNGVPISISFITPSEPHIYLF